VWREIELVLRHALEHAASLLEFVFEIAERGLKERRGHGGVGGRD
jgi:hypothetical protein